jgi:hypothetical protein
LTKYPSRYKRDPISVNPRGSLVSLRIGGRGQGEGRYALLSPSQAEKIAAALMRASRHSHERRLMIERLKCRRNTTQDERHLYKLCR